MTPKEQANDLIEMYKQSDIVNDIINDDICTEISTILKHQKAIQFSLISVDMIINCDSFFKTLGDSKEFINYWQEVQNELNKM